MVWIIGPAARGVVHSLITNRRPLAPWVRDAHGMGWRQFFEVAAEAHGPVALGATAAACGLPPARVRRRARDEGWWQPFPDVVAPPGTIVDDRAWMLAAVLHATARTPDPDRGLAVVRGWSALARYGIRSVAPTRVQLLIHADRRLADHPRLELQRTRTLSAADVQIHDRVAVLRGAVLLRHLAGSVDADVLLPVAVDLIQRRLTSVAELQGLLDRHHRFQGRGALVDVVATLSRAGRTDSPAELEARERLAAEGVALDRGQVPVPTATGGRLHLDLGIAAIRFGIEVEGFRWHHSPGQLDADAERANAVVGLADGWQVLRLTWNLMHRAWPQFVAQVRTVVAAQSRRHLGLDWPRPEDLRD